MISVCGEGIENIMGEKATKVNDKTVRESSKKKDV